MKMIIIALALAFSCASANAVNLDQVSGCMQIPEDLRGLGSSARIKVELWQSGEVRSVDVISYKPDSPEGRQLAHLSAEAVVACGPYPDDQLSSEIIYWPEGMRAVITMPDNADGTDNSLTNEIQQLIDGK